MAGEKDSDLTTFAAKLTYLYETVHPPGRGPYSDEEVAAAIKESGEDSVSGSYLYTLRAGKRTNPGLKYVGALAKFFGVDPNFFFDTEVTRAVTHELQLVTALRDAGVKGLALRAAGLSEISLEQLAQMAEHVRRLEGLPAEPALEDAGESDREGAERRIQERRRDDPDDAQRTDV